MEKIVLDSHAVIKLLRNEDGAGKVEEIINEAKESRSPLLMSVVNLGEVFYIIQRKHGTEEALKACGILESVPINMIPAGKEISMLAASIKSGKKMSYADCFAAATAMMHKAALVTGDREFREVEKDIKILWI